MIYFDAVQKVQELITICNFREGFSLEDCGALDRNDLCPAGSHVRVQSIDGPDFIAQTYSYPVGTQFR